MLRRHFLKLLSVLPMLPFVTLPEQAVDLEPLSEPSWFMLSNTSDGTWTWGPCESQVVFPTSTRWISTYQRRIDHA